MTFSVESEQLPERGKFHVADISGVSGTESSFKRERSQENPGRQELERGFMCPGKV